MLSSPAEQIEQMKEGATLILRNAIVEMFHNFMRVAVDRWGLIDPSPTPLVRSLFKACWSLITLYKRVQETVNTSPEANLSAVEYELVCSRVCSFALLTLRTLVQLPESQAKRQTPAQSGSDQQQRPAASESKQRSEAAAETSAAGPEEAHAEEDETAEDEHADEHEPAPVQSQSQQQQQPQPQQQEEQQRELPASATTAAATTTHEASASDSASSSSPSGVVSTASALAQAHAAGSV